MQGNIWSILPCRFKIWIWIFSCYFPSFGGGGGGGGIFEIFSGSVFKCCKTIFIIIAGGYIDDFRLVKLCHALCNYMRRSFTLSVCFVIVVVVVVAPFEWIHTVLGCSVIHCIISTHLLPQIFLWYVSNWCQCISDTQSYRYFPCGYHERSWHCLVVC